MKDLPLSPIQKFVERTLLPLNGNQAISPGPEKSLEAVQNVDASVVNVPRTKSKEPTADDAGAVLESFLKQVQQEKDVVAAHGGLEASRVHDLLNDSD